MLYSKSAEYAIQALIYLAEKNSPEPVMVSEIAEAYNIPQPFLAKIAQTLANHKILKAFRGRNGGFKLARPADQIYIRQIVKAIDGPGEERCVIGLDLCSDEQPCPFHKEWMEINRQIQRVLETKDLKTVAHKAMEKRAAMRAAGIQDLIGTIKNDDNDLMP
jgi:Rrf2 family protein